MLVLEIVPIGVVGISRPGIRRDDALDHSAPRVPTIAPTRSAHLRHSPRPILGHALHHTRRERHLCTRLLALPALSAARRLGLGDRWRKHTRRRLERRCGYRRRVDPLFIVDFRRVQ